MKENRESIPNELQGLFVPYVLAYKLQHYNSKEEEAKERALFNTECIAFWNHYQEIHFNHTYDEYARHLKAPTYQQVIDWFREKNIIITVKTLRRDDLINHWGRFIDFNKTNNATTDSTTWEDGISYNEYYEALNKAIEQALKNLK